MTARTEARAARTLGGWLLAALMALLLLAGCGSDDANDATPAVPAGVTKEDANRVSSTIGPAGGTLQTTASDGTRYTLTIPANALPSAREIAMTPVTAIGGYPLAGGPAAGVEFGPAGTVFAEPASLVIETAKVAPAGSVAVAILYTDDGQAFQRSFVGQGAGTYTLPIEHFSGATVGFATAAELAALADFQGTACLAPALAQASSDTLSALFTTYSGCFANDVLPALEAATDDVMLATAIGKYVMWKELSRSALGAELFATFDDSAETSQYLGVLVGKLQAAIERNDQKCRADQSIAALVNVLFWQSQATRFGIDSAANRLDRATVERELCARLVIASLTLADPLQSTVPSDLDATFELLFEGQPLGQAVPVQVSFSGTNATFGKASPANSNLQGDFTLAVGAQTASQPVTVLLRACLVVDGQVVPGLCVEQTAQRNGSAAIVVRSGVLIVKVEVAGGIGGADVSGSDSSYSTLDSASANLPFGTYTIFGGQVHASGNASITRRVQSEGGGVQVFTTTFKAQGLIQPAPGTDPTKYYSVVSTVDDNLYFTLPVAHEVAATWTSTGSDNRDGMWLPVFERRDEGGVLIESVVPATVGEFVRLGAGNWSKLQRGRFKAWYPSDSPPSGEFIETVTLRPAQ